VCGSESQRVWDVEDEHLLLEYVVDEREPLEDAPNSDDEPARPPPQPAQTAQPQQPAAMDEDEELNLAIAMSLAEADRKEAAAPS